MYEGARQVICHCCCEARQSPLFSAVYNNFKDIFKVDVLLLVKWTVRGWLLHSPLIWCNFANSVLRLQMQWSQVQMHSLNLFSHFWFFSLFSSMFYGCLNVSWKIYGGTTVVQLENTPSGACICCFTHGNTVLEFVSPIFKATFLFVIMHQIIEKLR